MASDRVARHVARLLDECEAAISGGDWLRAGHLADAALRLDPANADATAYLAAAGGFAAQVPAPARPASPEPPAERRQMTVMFCDLVDSTPLAEQLDPEDLRDILRAYHEACDAIVQRFGGNVAHYMGDGLLVYFGYPVAQEDAAVKAVLAGLEIVLAVPALGKESGRPVDLQSRVGIHHGLAVIGQMGSGKRIEPSDVVGRTPNLAARLQSVAAPGTVLISGELARLVQGKFQLEPAGWPKLKGISEPVETWRAIRAIESGEDGATSADSLGPIVGREKELRKLRTLWQRTLAGASHVAVLKGEAGIGKTRLVQALRAHAVAGPHVVVELRCAALHQGSALYPVLEHLSRRVLQFAESDSAEDRIARIRAETATWPALGWRPLDASPAELLASAFELPTTLETAALSPQERKAQTFEMVTSWVVQIAASSPLLLIVEDLHWIDPSSLELLLLIMERCQGHRVMICLTARPDFTLVWPRQPSLAELDLARLTVRDATRLAALLPAGSALSDDVRGRIVARSDGIPLFVEELIRTVSASAPVAHGEGPKGVANTVDVPATLHDSLMARLDRMGTARRVAQVASTLGRQFAFDMLRALGELDEASLQRDLDKLTEAGILVLQGRGGRLEYAFRHALIQDVAYQSLLRSERARLHGRIADVYEREFARLAEREPEVVAYHLAEAHQLERAIDYLARAGQQAAARWANQEAVALLDRSIEMLEAMPEGGDRDRQELKLRFAVGGPLIATRGYADAEVERNYGRAVELCSREDRAADRFQSLWGLRRFYQVRGNFARSVELATELLTVAPAVDATAVALADAAAGDALWLTGDLRSARTYLSACAQRLDRPDTLSPPAKDACTRALAEYAVVLWLQGDPAGATAAAARAVSEAEAIGDPFLICWAISFRLWVAHLEGDTDAVRIDADETHALAVRNGFKYFEAVGLMFGGWCSAMRGEDPELSRISAGIDLYNSIGAESALSYFEAMCAQAALAVGRPESARGFVTEGLAVADKNGERTFLPELYRLGAEVAAALHQRPAEVVEQLERALLAAREIGAPALGLRAALTLSRLVPAEERVPKLVGEFLSGIDPGAKSAEILLARNMASTPV